MRVREVTAAGQRGRRIDDGRQHPPDGEQICQRQRRDPSAGRVGAADRTQFAVQHQHARRVRRVRSLPAYVDDRPPQHHTPSRGRPRRAGRGRRPRTAARRRPGTPRSSPSSRRHRGRRRRRCRRSRPAAAPRPTAVTGPGRRRSPRPGCSRAGSPGQVVLGGEVGAGVLQLERSRQAGPVVVVADADPGQQRVRVGVRQAPPVEADDALQVGDHLSLDRLAVQVRPAEPLDPFPAAVPGQLGRHPHDGTPDPRFLGWSAEARGPTLRADPRR